MTPLMALLRERIVPRRAIPFSEFMELALYCPDFGYYERSDTLIGRSGDFFTSVSTGPLFGELLAFQIDAWFEAQPAHPTQIVEAGAHHGQLAADILAWFRRCRPNRFSTLEYWLVEPTSHRQERQKNKLEEFRPQVRWCDSLSALPHPGIHGVIVANELLDAFPVHRLGWDSARRAWFEWGVSWTEEKLLWIRMDEISPGLLEELESAGLNIPPELAAALPNGFVIEIAPSARIWWQEAARRLRAGRLITFDYGQTALGLLSPARSDGTARAYFRHHVTADLLAIPGEQDLTADINFSQIQKAGEAAGLRTAGLWRQSQFLTDIFARTVAGEFDLGTAKRKRQFQTLTHPEHLGHAFHVLVQARGIEPERSKSRGAGY